MIKTIEHDLNTYPVFQASGNASRFAIPFAKEVCHGVGVDIGCMKPEWAFPGAIPIDLGFDDNYHATYLPHVGELDYIFSSHCLEHINDWVKVMDYWTQFALKPGGTLFLYLPDYSQSYWRPWSNRKHVNILTPQFLQDYLVYRKYTKIFVSGIDLNNSFMVMAQTPL
jgi:SAM-dependent methyltransferase